MANAVSNIGRTAPGANATNSISILERIATNHSPELRAWLIECLCEMIERLRNIDNPPVSITRPFVKESESPTVFQCEFVVKKDCTAREFGFLLEEVALLERRLLLMQQRADMVECIANKF